MAKHNAKDRVGRTPGSRVPADINEAPRKGRRECALGEVSRYDPSQAGSYQDPVPQSKFPNRSEEDVLRFVIHIFAVLLIESAPLSASTIWEKCRKLGLRGPEEPEIAYYVFLLAKRGFIMADRGTERLARVVVYWLEAVPEPDAVAPPCLPPGIEPDPAFEDMMERKILVAARLFETDPKAALAAIEDRGGKLLAAFTAASRDDILRAIDRLAEEGKKQRLTPETLELLGERKEFFRRFGGLAIGANANRPRLAWIFEREYAKYSHVWDRFFAAARVESPAFDGICDALEGGRFRKLLQGRGKWIPESPRPLTQSRKFRRVAKWRYRASLRGALSRFRRMSWETQDIAGVKS